MTPDPEAPPYPHLSLVPTTTSRTPNRRPKPTTTTNTSRTIMLSDETRATPRPQPPAKVRARKSSQPPVKLSTRGKASSGSPPPPYYNPSDSVLGSPLPVTSQLLEASTGGNGGDGPGPESWLLEKSREELSGLLTKAEGIIKSREERMSLIPLLSLCVLSPRSGLVTLLSQSFIETIGGR